MNFKRFALVLALFCLAALAGAQEPSNAKPKKVLIFTANFGGGHNATAAAIKTAIEKKSSNIQVVVADIGVISDSKLYREFNQYLYNWMVKYTPSVFDRWYEAMMKKSETAKTVDDLRGAYYNEKKVLAFIKNENPDLIISAFDIAATTLGRLRLDQQLKNVPIAWIHTDYVVQAHHQVISKSIDMTFLAHEIMTEEWIKAGISPDKVMTTGMPVNPKAALPMTLSERSEFLRRLGFDPSVPTVSLVSGAQGVGDFPEIIESLARDTRGPLQIIAVCGKNKRHMRRLQKMKASLISRGIDIAIAGFIPNEEVLKAVKASDVYITKSGGISASEALVIGKPLVLLDINGGQERYNSDFFEEHTLALVARTEAEAGRKVKTLLDNPDLRRLMLQNQAAAASNMQLVKIADYAVMKLCEKNLLP